jgi:hypothetical protein
VRRTGVVVGCPGCTHEQAHMIKDQLERTFAGVVFSVVGGMVGSVSFEYDDGDRWADEAKAALEAWHKLEDAVPARFKDQRLGMPWPQVVREYIGFLRQEVVA